MLKLPPNSKSQGGGGGGDGKEGNSICVALPSLSNSKVFAPSHSNAKGFAKSGQNSRYPFSNSFTRRVSRVNGTSSLPSLHATIGQKPWSQSKALQNVTLTGYQCFLQGYHESSELDQKKGTARGHAPTPLGTSRSHISNELGHVVDEDEERFRNFFGRVLNDPGHSSKTLANTRHRQLRQRRLRAGDGLEPPWDALGQNSCMDVAIQKKAKQDQDPSCTMKVSDGKNIEARLNWETGQFETGEERKHDTFGISYEFHQSAHLLKETLDYACQSLHALLFEMGESEIKDPPKSPLAEMRQLCAFVNRPEACLSFMADFFLDDFISFFERSPRGERKGSPRGERMGSKNRAFLDLKLCIRRGLQSLCGKQDHIKSRRLERFGEADEFRRCCLDELFRLMWPDDFASKAGLVVIALLDQLRVVELPLLPQTQHEELVDNYNFLALAALDGAVRFADLVQAGLVDAPTMGELRERFDNNHDGIIQADEFVEMLCPAGHRAHEHVSRAVDASAQPMSHILADCGGQAFDGWILDKDMDRIPPDYWQLVVAKFPEDQL